jgi:hypothetical protein
MQSQAANAELHPHQNQRKQHTKQDDQNNSNEIQT